MGRPPAIRAVYSFEESSLDLPDEIAVDTSFIVEALLPREPLHAACRAMLLRMVEGGTAVFFNRLLEMELFETTYKLALVERHGKRNWRRRRLDGRARRRANRLSQVMLNAWRELLSRRLYRSNGERLRALGPWVEFYNRRRSHTALGGRPPISRLWNNVGGNYI